jgi:hypothetical protein
VAAITAGTASLPTAATSIGWLLVAVKAPAAAAHSPTARTVAEAEVATATGLTAILAARGAAPTKILAAAAPGCKSITLKPLPPTPYAEKTAEPKDMTTVVAATAAVSVLREEEARVVVVARPPVATAMKMSTTVMAGLAIRGQPETAMRTQPAGVAALCATIVTSEQVLAAAPVQAALVMRTSSAATVVAMAAMLEGLGPAEVVLRLIGAAVVTPPTQHIEEALAQMALSSSKLLHQVAVGDVASC